jgi:hypothetical protein
MGIVEDEKYKKQYDRKQRRIKSETFLQITPEQFDE